MKKIGKTGGCPEYFLNISAIAAEPEPNYRRLISLPFFIMSFPDNQ
ncbi:MAG TPA: hypothetical protein VMY06_11500 [Sedimentisphaerales bacterium]|nr:hypothetical protein [Sedimentisphaerales bacterium]